MKKILFFIISLATSTLVRAQAPAGAPPVRKTESAIVRPKLTPSLPIRTGTAATPTPPPATATTTTSSRTSVPIRTTVQAGSGRTGKETLIVKPGGNTQAAGNRPLLPSDSAVRQKKAPAN